MLPVVWEHPASGVAYDAAPDGDEHTEHEVGDQADRAPEHGGDHDGAHDWDGVDAALLLLALLLLRLLLPPSLLLLGGQVRVERHEDGLLAAGPHVGAEPGGDWRLDSVDRVMEREEDLLDQTCKGCLTRPQLLLETTSLCRIRSRSRIA